MPFSTLNRVVNTSLVDATKFALKPCASKLLKSTANTAGNWAWHGKSRDWQRQTTLIYAAFSVTLASAAICAAAKCGTQTDNKKKAFKIAAGAGAATCAIALSTLFQQVADIQAWGRGWDFQYPEGNISFIAQEAPFYC